jgi:predicted TIM-barrel fold metal-dependent hydrolase
MPLSLHIGSGGDRGARERAESGQPYWHNMDALISLPSEVQCALTTITFSGALERHPGLVLISAEYDLGWMPYFLQNLDRLYQRWSPMLGLNLTAAPSDYIKRQVRMTFIRDRAGLGMVSAGLLSADTAMWCDDYPHGASTFPNSRVFVGETMADLSDQHRQKIVHDNAAALYGLGTG